MREIIPSEHLPDARAALSSRAPGAQSVSAAVAFVTEAGVDHLREIFGGRTVDLAITARASDATTPEALLKLRDELGADVSVVIGRHAPAFHPKLWLLRGPDRLSVLSGSGNLTGSGMSGNVEQFELVDVDLTDPAGADQAELHEQRLDALTAHAVPLDEVVGTAIWRTWLDVRKEQARHRDELRRLEAKLARYEPVSARTDDKLALLNDMYDLYHRTVAVGIPRLDGQRYVPTRFLQGLNRVRDDGADAVTLASNICRRRSEGFDVILAADRWDLTVEALVLDADKPYHDLFSPRTREMSAERLRLFPSYVAARQAAGP